MAKRLIINADGFGFTRGNNRGILECLQAGAFPEPRSADSREGVRVG